MGLGFGLTSLSPPSPLPSYSQFWLVKPLGVAGGVSVSALQGQAIATPMCAAHDLHLTSLSLCAHLSLSHS